MAGAAAGVELTPPRGVAPAGGNEAELAAGEAAEAPRSEPDADGATCAKLAPAAAASTTELKLIGSEETFIRYWSAARQPGS